MVTCNGDRQMTSARKLRCDWVGEGFRVEPRTRSSHRQIGCDRGRSHNVRPCRPPSNFVIRGPVDLPPPGVSRDGERAFNGDTARHHVETAHTTRRDGEDVPEHPCGDQTDPQPGEGSRTNTDRYLRQLSAVHTGGIAQVDDRGREKFRMPASVDGRRLRNHALAIM